MAQLIEKNGKFYKECKVVMLATDKYPALLKSISHVKAFGAKHETMYGWEDCAIRTPHDLNHLYFLSDEEIKEGYWFIEFNLNNKRSSYCNKPYLCDIGNTGGFILTKKDGNFPFPENCKKIIATTDSSIKINNPNYDIGELAYINLAKPSKEFIESYTKYYNIGKPINKVLVEYEAFRKDGCSFYLQPNGLLQAHDEHGWETLQKDDAIFKLKTKDNNIVIKKFEEKLFSELEVVGFLRKYKKHFNLEIDTEKELLFIENNLK